MRLSSFKFNNGKMSQRLSVLPRIDLFEQPGYAVIAARHSAARHSAARHSAVRIGERLDFITATERWWHKCITAYMSYKEGA